MPRILWPRTGRRRTGYSLVLGLGACRELAPSKQESTTYEPSLVCKLLILGCRLLIPDRLLGVEPLIGRGFTVSEQVPGNDDVVLISHGLWHRKFGGDPAIVGLTVMLRNRPTVVIGVLPASYRGVMPADLTRDRVRDLVFPLGLDEGTSRGAHFLRVVGRLDDGVTLEAARAEVNQLGQQLIDDGVTPHSITVHAFED